MVFVLQTYAFVEEFAVYPASFYSHVHDSSRLSEFLSFMEIIIVIAII